MIILINTLFVPHHHHYLNSHQFQSQWAVGKYRLKADGGIGMVKVHFARTHTLHPQIAALDEGLPDVQPEHVVLLHSRGKGNQKATIATANVEHQG